MANTSDYNELGTPTQSSDIIQSSNSSTAWIVLFVLALIAFFISLAINIYFCRGRCIQFFQDIRSFCREHCQLNRSKRDPIYKAVPSRVPSEKLPPVPQSDYEVPMGLNAKICKANTFPLPPENKPEQKDQNANDAADESTASGSVKAKRSIFEKDEGKAKKENKAVIDNVPAYSKPQPRSTRGIALKKNGSSESLDRHANYTIIPKEAVDSLSSPADADSAPEDVAPHAYEKISFGRKKSRKRSADRQKAHSLASSKPSTQPDKVIVVIEKDGAMTVAAGDAGDGDNKSQASMPEDVAPAAPYERISYNKKGDKADKDKQCSIM